MTAIGRASPSRWGVETGYVDASGVRRRVPRTAVEAVLEALQAGKAAPPPRPPAPRQGSGRCHLPPELHTWGWAAQLYALRSRGSWGIGDLADLRALGEWSRRLGAGMLLINPLHAVLPTLPQEPSPYFPSSRLFGNPLYLRIEEIAGAGDEPVVAELTVAGHALNEQPLLQRDRVFELKSRALDALYARFRGSRDFDRFCAREGETLQRYATFCVLAEKHRGPWRTWPSGSRTPAGRDVAAIAAGERSRVDFHRWVQWNFDLQLARAARQATLVHDLAVGFSPDGADAWMWQDLIAFGARVGAPPDEFSPSGQDWGLPPFDPHKLRAAGYAPLLETLRRAMRHAGGVRVDHVMGLFRLWWIPEGATDARGGAYVRYLEQDMLDILAAESARAGCYVVGEDLGTVAPEIRRELRRRRVMSYRLGWFEDRSPQRFPAQALAALTTHDLPTLRGIWEGSDSDPGVRERLFRFGGAWEGAGTEQVAESAHRALADAPSRLVTATLEDALGVAERPNRPGTTTEWPNWSLALPVPLEEIQRDPRPGRLAAAMRRF